MPEFTYARPVPRSYTEARDQQGVIVGQVELGDKRDFDAGDKPKDAPVWHPVPDECWVPAGEPLPPAWDGVSAGMYRLPEGDGKSAESKPEPPADDGEDKGGSDGGKRPVRQQGPLTPPPGTPDPAGTGTPAGDPAI